MLSSSCQSLMSKRRICYILILNITFISCVTPKTQPSFKGQWYTVQQGDTLLKISQRFSANLEDIIELNHIADSSKIRIEQKIFIPLFTKHSISRLPNSDVVQSTRSKAKKLKHTLAEQIKSLRWPLNTVVITSAFGKRKQRDHKGIDLRATQGSMVYAVSDGVVIRSDYDADGYGWYIVIQHGNGLETRYAHHRKNRVTVKQHVKKGQHIADSGSSGNSKGAHLHFEIRLSGESVDPVVYLPAIP